MASRNFILLSVFLILLIIGHAYGFVKRDMTQAPDLNILKQVKRNLNQFRACLDQSLAAIAGQVDVKQLQPVFDALGDQVDRLSKVFEILTSPQQRTPSAGGGILE
ncbi:uncharacterized protein LOC123869013 [Maniola jurtina]|uniref:uncharacterized protein LOC123869013 n=1 Tax=Maniola jurtina TaxID=191418 RepID=UPI001E68ACD7|nr:uncharacterized protein LOC123869013 [Maniola jurtina]